VYPNVMHGHDHCLTISKQHFRINAKRLAFMRVEMPMLGIHKPKMASIV